MEFKSLFNRKKKQSLPMTASNSIPTINSRSSSLNSRTGTEEEFKQVFKKFDVNGDGKISVSGLGSIMCSLGHRTTLEELEIMIKEVDLDGDGFINLREFIKLNTKDIEPDELLQNLKEAFSVFDIDKNGSTSAEELQNVFKSLGEECTLSECKTMISAVDADGNGTTSFDEFKVMMMGSEPKIG